MAVMGELQPFLTANTPALELMPQAPQGNILPTPGPTVMEVAMPPLVANILPASTPFDRQCQGFGVPCHAGGSGGIMMPGQVVPPMPAGNPFVSPEGPKLSTLPGPSLPAPDATPKQSLLPMAAIGAVVAYFLLEA